MTDVAALFVDPKGIYPELLGSRNCWDSVRDARTYVGGSPVVAHPECSRWINFAAVNWARYKKILPAWYPGGHDEGCFESALRSVRTCLGVLEHPASTHAWKHYGLEAPERGKWTLHCWENKTGSPVLYPECAYWTCEISQGAYGHPCRKLTWLLYCGKRPPFELRWDRSPGTHQIGFHDKRGKAANKPTISGKAASATPRAFAEELIRLAEWSQG